MSNSSFKIFLLFFLCICLLSPAHAAKKKSGPKSLSEEILQGAREFKQRTGSFSKSEWDFALGFAHYKEGNWKEAEKFFDGLDEKLPVAADYVIFYRASAANELGRPHAALTLLEKLKKEHPSSVLTVPAKLELAKAMMGLGRFSEARTVLNDYKRNVNGDRSFDADILIARCFVNDGDGSDAINYVRTLALSAGSEEKISDLYPVMDEIKRRFHSDIRDWLMEPVQQYRVAKSFIERSQWDEAVSVLKGILDEKSLGSAMRTEVAWLLAKSLRSIHRYDEAISIMENLVHDPFASGFMDSVLSTLATTYTKKNEYEKAIAIRRKMMEESPVSSAGQARMAVKIAFLYMDEGRYKDAITLWQSALRLKSLGKLAVTAKWYLAWCNYMSGNYAQAVSLFSEMLRAGGRKTNIHDRLLYWKGRAFLKQGKPAEARGAFLETISSHPGGYYAELSKRRLKKDERDFFDFSLAEKNMRGMHAGHREDGEGRDYVIAAKSHLQKAVFFDKLSLRDEAAGELRKAGAEAKLSLTRDIVGLAHRNFAHDVTYRMAETAHAKFLKTNMPDGRSERTIWESAFPRAYSPLTDEFTKGSEVSPLFVWSIMRNESAFRPSVTSPAGAVGLMQLMPTTANRLAREEDLKGVDRRDLYDPSINLGWGVAYLKKLSILFPNNPVAWAASYNAGEEAVARWLANGSAGDVEEWIEEIPYDETNLYVKKVITSYWKYQRLYSFPSPL